MSSNVVELEKIKQFLYETERLGQEIIKNKEEIVAWDYRRQKTREALRALKTNADLKKKAWLSMANVFIKIESDKAQKMLETEMKEIDKEIVDLREKMKMQVKQLRDLEGKPELTGFDLKPLTKESEIIMKSVMGL